MQRRWCRLPVRKKQLRAKRVGVPQARPWTYQEPLRQRLSSCQAKEGEEEECGSSPSFSLGVTPLPFLFCFPLSNLRLEAPRSRDLSYDVLCKVPMVVGDSASSAQGKLQGHCESAKSKHPHDLSIKMGRSSPKTSLGN